MIKKTITLAVLFLLLLNTVSAITGSIGNAKMTLRLQPGEEIEKYILVKNVNDVSLTIELFPTGELEKNVKLKEESFTLLPKEEKKAYFTIKAGDEGTSETKINVKFTPEEGNGVGLTSTIIIIASGEDLSPENEEEENIEEVIEEENETGVSFGIKNREVGKVDEEKFPLSAVLSVSSIVLVVAFLILVFYYIKANKKKVRRSNA